MQTANVMVANGGDRGNSVPKYRVTAGEIAVLMAIHGQDAVYDIEPAEDVDVSSGAELTRLKAVYGMARDEDGISHIDRLFPGAGARLPTGLADLGIEEHLFKPTERAKPKPDTTTGDPEVAGKGGQTASPGSFSRPDHYEPPEVPAEEGVGLESPTNQPQVDKPVGTALAAGDDKAKTNTPAGAFE